MSHTVIKIGGSVLGGPTDASKIIEVLSLYQGPIVLVVSALRGLTDRLIERARAGNLGAASRRSFARGLIAPHLELAEAFGAPRETLCDVEKRLAALADELVGLFAGDSEDRYPRIASFGERLSAEVARAALAALGREARVLEPRELGIIARGPSLDAELDAALAYPRIRKRIIGAGDVIVPGFYGVGIDGLVRLFGRGGSDYSAAIIAAALEAESCILVKDAEGILTADPRLVPKARPVPQLSYLEAAELSRGGAKVIHPRAVAPLEEAGVPLIVIGESHSDRGTVVGGRLAEENRRRGVAGHVAGRVRAIALAADASGSAVLTLAGEDSGGSALPLVFRALEDASLGPWSIQGGESPASLRVLVPASRGGEALRAIHASLFEHGTRTRRTRV